ncbi:MAG: nucleotide exchange factor GrpE [Lachnospiraceae bacterium]|nr:nucleotide exchange factor GrpE [Lachnospiraceae bacterium]
MAEKKENFDTEEVKAEETKKETSEEIKEETVDSKEETKEETKKETKEETSEKEETEKPKKKFGKKKDKRDEQIEELTDKVKRQLAEFENFRTRSEKEKAQMFDMGAKTIVEKILPVVDNFERGLAGVEEGDAFGEGMKMVYKQMMTALEEAGVTPIEAVGQEFNPEFHNAVMQVESEEYESGVVAQELQKGYMYRDTVVRHSMVAVVQ